MGKLISITKNWEFKKIFKKGKSIVDKLIVVYYYKNGFSFNRIGIVVNKKVGKAVIRNRVKRIIKECYRGNELEVKKGFDIVIVARVRASEASYSEIYNNLKRIFNKSGLFIRKDVINQDLVGNDNNGNI